jgi:hypothetical protein
MSLRIPCLHGNLLVWNLVVLRVLVLSESARLTIYRVLLGGEHAIKNIIYPIVLLLY